MATASQQLVLASLKE